METGAEIIRIILGTFRDIPSILVNIIGGLVFAKLVFRNMMKNSGIKTAGDKKTGESIGRGKVPVKDIIINEITRQDVILPASAASLESYRNIFRGIKLRFIFMAGCIVFPALLFVPAGSMASYYVIAVNVLFLIFLMALLFIYIRHVYTLKKISVPMVVLRVFGLKSNTQYLFNKVVSMWNNIGATFTIMDPVYARSEFTIFNSPKNIKIKLAQVLSFIPGSIFVEVFPFNNAFYNFIFVIISTLVIFLLLLAAIAGSFFIKDIKSLLDEINADSNFSKTWKGTGKQVNLYCFDNIWKHALREMLGKAEIVLMDLRGFSSERKGCAYEISHLVNNFDLDKVLFLINSKTDKHLVIETLQQQADRISAGSPNALKEKLNVSIYSCEKQNMKDTRQIMQVLCNRLNGNIDNPEAETVHPYSTSVPLIQIPALLLVVIFSIALTFNIIFTSYGVSYFKQLNFYEGAQDIMVAAPPQPLAQYELPTFSKATADLEPHFVRMTIVLGYYETPELDAELATRNEEMQHIINILLLGKTYEDLDSAGDVISLSEEIKAHINIRLTSGKISEVYFKDFIVN